MIEMMSSLRTRTHDTWATPCAREGRQRCARRWGWRSAVVVHGDFERLTKLPHPDIGKAPDSFGEDAESDTLDRVHVDHAVPWYRVVAWLEDNLTGQAADGRRARSDDRPSKPRDGGIARQHDYRPSANVGKLTPPDVTPSGRRAHDAADAARNDARSPHSSSSSRGWLS